MYWLMLLTATHLPPAELPKTHVSDKIEHFTAYGVLTFLLSLAIGQRNGRLPAAVITCAMVLTYGAIDELTQPPFGRSCDIHDWYADAAGAVTATLVVWMTARLLRRSSR